LICRLWKILGIKNSQGIYCNYTQTYCRKE